MMKWIVIVFIMLCSFIRGQEDAGRCTPLPNDPACGCTFEDGMTINLRSVGFDNGCPAFNLEVLQGTFIYYNPCYPFNIPYGCINVALCFVENGGDTYSLGAQNPTFKVNNGSLIIQYRADGRISEITLKCGSGTPSFSYVELNFSERYYNFTLTTPAACCGPLAGRHNLSETCFELQPSYASKCSTWCIVGIATGAGVVVVVGLLIFILKLLCRKRSGSTKRGILDTKPKYTELKKIFDDKVADWDSVCPYLLNDEDGQKTRKIRMNSTTVMERSDEMLTEFLKQSRPTWRRVINALREGKYDGVADEIERDLLAKG